MYNTLFSFIARNKAVTGLEVQAVNFNLTD